MAHKKSKKQKKQKKGRANTQTIDVFTTNWSGSANENFNWSNGTNTPVLVQKNGNNTFPFVTNPPGGNSISVAPGSQGCQLIGVASATPYSYNTTPSLNEGNPKYVVIT